MTDLREQNETKKKATWRKAVRTCKNRYNEMREIQAGLVTQLSRTRTESSGSADNQMRKVGGQELKKGGLPNLQQRKGSVQRQEPEEQRTTP